jgi:hypothetical protein
MSTTEQPTTVREAATQISTQTVEERIEFERRRLQKASAVLACLMLAADAQADIDLADVASAAQELVLAALLGLDSINLMATP